METKEYSYQNYEVLYKIEILGQDISNDLMGIEGIEASLDYPTIDEYRIAEATFTLKDHYNNYNPQKADNFYKTHGTSETPPITESGYRSPVIIRAGFIVNETEHTEIVYSGEILNITKNAKNGQCRIVCTDATQDIRNETVTNFGVDKKVKVEPSGGGLHGNYPFFSGLTEPSEESIMATSDGTDLERKDVLRTEGALSEYNFRELETGIETEGGPLDEDPIITFKSPFRSRTIQSVIKKLLIRYGIPESKQDLELPSEKITNNFFSSLGRPGYEIGFSDTSATDPGIWQWPGFISDMIADNSNDVLYLLITSTGSAIPDTPNPRPQIVKWDLETDDRTVIATINQTSGGLEEYWKLIANNNFSEFYILGTQPVYHHVPPNRDPEVVIRPGFEFGSYDSSEYTNTVDSKVRILKVTGANNPPGAVTTYINPDDVNDDLLPQLAMHYHLGFSRTESQSQNRYPNRQGNLPDSRRNLFLDSSGNLYYPYAKRQEFGVAKATAANTATAIIRANRDEDGFNLANFDFWITNSYVYLAYTNIGLNPSQSRFKIIRKDLV